MNLSHIVGPGAALSVLLAASALQGQPPAKADDPLALISWAVGGRWVAEVKAADGAPMTVEATFAWAGHKKAVTYRILFTAKDKAAVQYEGLYWWHPARKQVRMLQTDRQGNVTEAALTGKGNKLTQQNAHVRTDGTTQEQLVEIVRDGDDAFTFQAFVPKGKEWVGAVRITYRRVRDKGDAPAVPGPALDVPPGRPRS